MLKGGNNRPGDGRARIIISHPVTSSQFELYASTVLEERGMTRLKPTKLSTLERQALFWFVDSGLTLHTKPKPPANGSHSAKTRLSGAEWKLPSESLSWNVTNKKDNSKYR